MHRNTRIWIGTLAALQVMAQDPTALGQVLANAGGAGGAQMANAAANATPGAVSAPRPGQAEEQLSQQWENAKRDEEVRLAKAKDQGPLRFAADLFETRQYGLNPTDGGIAEDYVLGVGDRLQLNAFGSATFETPLQVDGRGEVVIPKVGTVPVAGMSLGRARAAIQTKVAQNFSRSTVDLSVTKLREVRVFVLGEVYKPGSYLVPSLSSIINVLSLTGGPTAVGSFREIRVLRGGRPVHAVDLYPLRAEGVGNLNFSFQNGDTLFVPLIKNTVRMEGGFTRVVATVPAERIEATAAKETDEERRINRQIQDLQSQLNLQPDKGKTSAGSVLGMANGTNQVSAPAAQGAGTQPVITAVPAATAPTTAERARLENRLDLLQQYLLQIKTKSRGDKRIHEGDAPGEDELAGQPTWLSQWLLSGVAPAMQFELLPGETIQDALGFAGGFALNAFSGSVSLRRVNPGGALTVVDVPAGEPMAKCILQKGDVLTALPLRDFEQGAVSVGGWARVQGTFARKDGQRVGELLKSLALLLPDTYMERGELVRTYPDGSKRYLPFSLTKALAGDAEHDLLLENRDAIELYRKGDLRLPLSLTVLGPVTRPGRFEFIEGMRASDLLFRAGLPLRSADQYVAELAHTREGKPVEVRRLDLARLVSSADASPVDLKDDQVNPMMEPFDQLTIFSKPDFRQHRTITLSGQVARPGSYELLPGRTSLRDVIARAGGLTSEAMPNAGVFLRGMAENDPEKKRASQLAGVDESDPTSNGVNAILSRLNETKRTPLTGTLMESPVLHGLTAGTLNRMVVDIPALLDGDPSAEVELQDGDQVIIPRKTEVAYVVGETASPFSAYKVTDGMKVKDLIEMAGGGTPNADSGHIRLLKANGRIVDSWVSSRRVEPGDAVLVPQRIDRDVTWQDNLSALTPLAVMINAIRK